MLLCAKPLRVNLGGNRKNVGDFQNYLGENSKKLNSVLNVLQDKEKRVGL